jgi:uncharacterized protein YecE (DUF72 family)
MESAGKIHIGTSGWHYDHWEGVFYPSGLAKKDFLDYYNRHFHTVEINNSFYQLPKEKTLEKWREISNEGFLFSVKASRYITHMKKLKDPQEPLSFLLLRIETLGDKLGPILFQLPPRWRFNPTRFSSFLNALPGGKRYAFEFRDHSWLNDQAYEAMQEHGVAFCIYDLAGFTSPKEVTADFVYTRLHGPGEAYQGQYSTRTLSDWAGAFSTWSAQGKDIYCYFDNDEAGYAAQDAMRLQEMLSKG